MPKVHASYHVHSLLRNIWFDSRMLQGGSNSSSLFSTAIKMFGIILVVFTLYIIIMYSIGSNPFDKKVYGFSDPAPINNGITSSAPASTITAATDTANNLAPATSSAVVEKFEDTPSITTGPISLQNVQPLTIKQAAFLGPLPDGHFDTEVGAVQALRAGFRSFIFQIDYLDKRRDENYFSEPGVPTLLYRGDDGGLISENSADIKAVAESIANAAFRPEIPKNTDPVLIYLHILRSPSITRDPDGYKAFLTKIATALNPLAPNHLGMTPLGTFNRQKQEEILLNSPLKAFEGQVIILCNADTTIFRNTKEQINPSDDLDFWVNMRVYLYKKEDSIGITTAAPAATVPSAVVLYLDDILDLSSEKEDAFAVEAKNHFVIAMPRQLSNPKVNVLNLALNKLSVNMIGLDIFSDKIDDVKELIKEYDNLNFRPKPVGLRNSANN